MRLRGVLVMMAFLFAACPSWGGDAAQVKLLETLAKQPAEQWVATLRQSRSLVDAKFLNLAMRQCIAFVAHDRIPEATRFAEIADVADCVRGGEKEFRVVGQALLGRRLIELKKYDAALALGQRMLKLASDDYLPNMLIGIACLRRGEFSAAAGALKHAAQARPESEDVHLALATAYQRLGDFASAQNELRRVLEINPKNRIAIDNLDVLNGVSRMGTLSKNAAAMQHYQQAESLFIAHDFKGAIKHYREAIAADPQFAKAYVFLAQSYFLMNELPTALKFYKKAVELNPNDSQAQFFFGDAYLAQYDRTHDAACLDNAIAGYEAALRIQPGYRAVAVELARARDKKARRK